MDTSPEYIRMCEQATEIREDWKPKGGDWYLHDYHGSTGFSPDLEKQFWGHDEKTWERVEILAFEPSDSKDIGSSTDGKEGVLVSIKELIKGRTIWLPRQDQLQTMTTYGASPPSAIHEMDEFIHKPYLTTDANHESWESAENYFSTWEQLWLALVMQEKFGKRWSGTDWVAIAPNQS